MLALVIMNLSHKMLKNNFKARVQKNLFSNKTSLQKIIFEKKRRNFCIQIIHLLFFSHLLWSPKINLASEKNDISLSDAFVTVTGLKIVDFKNGKGDSPEWGDFVKVNFVIYILKNKKIEKIDSTYDRKKSYLYKHGNGQISDGFEEAVHSMKEGGKRRIILSNDDLYFQNGFGPTIVSYEMRQKFIKAKEDKSEPAAVSIIFDIELVEIKKSLDRKGLF
jgi:hypothetical protein